MSAPNFMAIHQDLLRYFTKTTNVHLLVAREINSGNYQSVRFILLNHAMCAHVIVVRYVVVRYRTKVEDPQADYAGSTAKDNFCFIRLYICLVCLIFSSSTHFITV